jgi:hypothetical protein
MQGHRSTKSPGAIITGTRFTDQNYILSLVFTTVISMRTCGNGTPPYDTLIY